MKKKGLITLPGFQVFELPKSENRVGGLLTAIDDKLCPGVITADESSSIEIMTVQIRTGNYNIRIINAYGPQEDSSDEDINLFWHLLDEEVLSAKDNNCLILIQLDTNAKVGSNIIQGDPHKISGNGRILIELTERHNLTIANSLNICKGAITREKKLLLVWNGQ